MKIDLIEVEPILVLPTPAGTAVFISDASKTGVIYTSQNMGLALIEALSDEIDDTVGDPVRTHEFMKNVFSLFEVSMSKGVIEDEKEGVFTANIEFNSKCFDERTSMIQVACRPSDCITTSIRMKAPLFIKSDLWKRLPDRTHTLEFVKENFNKIHEGH